MAEPSSSLSARAQEILQRADAQLTSLRRPPSAPRRHAQPAGPEDLAQLVDTVEAGIEAARAHLAALSASLDRIAEELGHEPVAPPAPAKAEPAPLPPALQATAQPPPGTAAAPEPPPEEPAAPEPAPAIASSGEQAVIDRRTTAAHDAARLIAIEMAVAGDTREVVGRRLRNEFGIPDPKTILEDVFGPEGGPPSRGAYGA